MVNKEQHPTMPVTIRGKVCIIDNEIADLVKDLNEFTINNKKPFRSTSSCQEEYNFINIVGGKTHMILEPFDNFCEDITTMGKILADATQRIAKTNRRTCDVDLRLEYGRGARRHKYFPMLEIDCSIIPLQGYETRKTRKEFEKDRRETIQDIRESLRKFTEKIKIDSIEY